MADKTQSLGTYKTRDEAECAASRGQGTTVSLTRFAYRFDVTKVPGGWEATVTGTREAIIHFQNAWRG